MRFFLVRRAEHNVDASAVGLPSGDAAGEMFVGVGDPRVIFLAILIGIGVWIGIAAQPELFDELFAFVVSLQGVECLALFVGDNPTDIFVLPAFVDALDAFLASLIVLLFLL